MRRLAMQVVVLVAAHVSLTAAAETIFRYHDPKTNRDVFVNQRDQIPLAHREQAQQVVADGVLVGSAPQAAKDSPAGTVIFGDGQSAGWWNVVQGMLRQMRGSQRIDCQRTLAMAVDTDLVRRGVRPLSADETQQGLTLVVQIGWMVLGVGLVAVVGWIWLMVQAWVGDQRAWTLYLLLFQPLSLLFALKFAEGKSRGWRALMSLLQLAPYGVLVTGACWLRAWFAAVLRARGLG